jgi:hypothetical protein
VRPRIDRFFDGVRFMGSFKSDRKTFHFFDGPESFYAMQSDNLSPLVFNIMRVPKDVVERIQKTFRGKIVTGPEADARFRLPSMTGLRALQVLTVQKRAAPRRSLKRGQAFLIQK